MGRQLVTSDRPLAVSLLCFLIGDGAVSLGLEGLSCQFHSQFDSCRSFSQD